MPKKKRDIQREIDSLESEDPGDIDNDPDNMKTEYDDQLGGATGHVANW